MASRYDVFLSYSRADAALVTPLRDELRRRGYTVFFDTQSIDPGERWKDRLERAVRESRTMVLCWSAHTRGSDYITFEYSRAEALGKAIYPWLLDGTPLPAMLEIQGMANADPAEVAGLLATKLGWAAGRRRKAQAALAAVVLAGASVVGWKLVHPPAPPPWIFQGEVTVSDKGQQPLEGVEVDLTSGTDHVLTTHTDAQGHYTFQLPQPQPKYVRVRFRKNGFEAEDPLNVPTGKPGDMAMLRLGRQSL